LANAVTHGIGLVLSIAGAIALMVCVLEQGDLWRIVGCGVYAASLVAVYAMSTLSHVATTPGPKRWFRTLDQGFIYLLIVGTYTPFALVYLRTTWWWAFLALMWSIALFGFFRKVLYAHRVDSVSIGTYLLLGWMPVVSATALGEQVAGVALWWMLIGGLCYTIGTAFLMNDTRVALFHAVWHVLVVAGSVWHFLSIFLFVAQAG
jgi:hemolysin III